jgi:hypothetical protein
VLSDRIGLASGQLVERVVYGTITLMTVLIV